MNAMSRLTLIFALVFAFFLLGPPFIKTEFSLFPLMSWAEILDLFTPLVLIPLYFLMAEGNKTTPVKRNEILVFLVLASIWVAGQAMHLTANSIGHLLDEMKESDIYKLTYFYDEKLGHYLWHFGMLSLAGLLLYRQARSPAPSVDARPALPLIAGLFHGIIFSLVVLEGTTIPLVLPLMVLILLTVLLFARRHIRQPLVLFFSSAYAMALVIFIVWRLVWGTFAEPLSVLSF